MTITEASAVNLVVSEVLTNGHLHCNDDCVSKPSSRVREACLHLVTKANKVLSAGLRPADIETRWPA